MLWFQSLFSVLFRTLLFFNDLVPIDIFEPRMVHNFIKPPFSPQPLLGVSLQQLFHEVLCILWKQILRHFQRCIFNVFIQFVLVWGKVRRNTHQKLVHESAHSVPVYTFAMGFALEHLRCHVSLWSAKWIWNFKLAVDSFGQPEICKFDMAICCNEDVVRF